MARDSQDVAAEVLDLVYRYSEDPDRCTYLLATKLEVIYDFAFALGYRQGKKFATEYAYGVGFADGEASVLRRQTLDENSKVLLPGNGESKRLEAKTEALGETAKQKALYRLPCDVCGALYTEVECPLCNRHAQYIS